VFNRLKNEYVLDLHDFQVCAVSVEAAEEVLFQGRMMVGKLNVE